VAACGSRRLLEVFKALLLVMFCRVVLGKVVGPVGGAAFPIDDELSLANAVPYPIKTSRGRVHGA
jgi:hypothetical protein